MKRKLIFLIFLLAVVHVVHAGNITMYLNQTDYYFALGDNAIINLTVNNTLGRDVDGMLSYTITQEINQAGFHYMSTNTKAVSLTINKGVNIIPINFGTSSQEMTLTVGLTYYYDDYETTLDDIRIHFVSQNNNVQNGQGTQSNNVQGNSGQNSQVKSTTRKSGASQNAMQSKTQQSQTSPSKNNPSNKLSNNQIAQDTSSLKKQMQDDIRKRNEMDEQFKKELAKNKDFQQMHKQMMNNGYNLTSINVNPQSNNTGSFEAHYKDKNGNEKTIKGKLKNGKLEKELSKEDVMNMLRNNQDFQKYDNYLRSKGYNMSNIEMNSENNVTKVNVNYKKGNKEDNIKAEIKDGKVRVFYKKKNYWWLAALLVFIIFLAGLYYLNKEKTDNKRVDSEKVVKKEVDVRDILKEAKELYREGKYKDAYGKAAYAMRYIYVKDREMTNDEVLRYMKEKGMYDKEVKECFDLCNLVEFAKQRPKDFDRIIEIIEKKMTD